MDESIDKVRREVMQTSVAVLPADVSIAGSLDPGEETRPRTQRLYPVVAQTAMIGVVTRKELHKLVREHAGEQSPLATVIKSVSPIGRALRAVVYRMAEASLTAFRWSIACGHQRLIGMVSLSDLLAAQRATRRRTPPRACVRLHLPFSRRTDDADQAETRQAG
jgi:hypothetical protein